MATIIDGATDDEEGRGSLACDVKGCEARYRPRHGATNHETLQLDANKRGWDCYVEGPTFYDKRDLCPKHRRKCVAAFSQRRGVYDPTITCDKRVAEVVNGDPLCKAHVRSRRRALGEL